MDSFLQKIVSEPIKEDNNSDIVRIRSKDGSINDKSALPDISYELFLKFMFHSGASDMEYFKYLREHNMKELTDFNTDGIENLYLVVEDGFRQRRLVFKAVYDSDKEET